MSALPPVQELVEQTLREVRADGCVVVAAQDHEASLRWAANRLTTNGQAHGRSVTVGAVRDGAGGPRLGVVSRPVAEPADLVALVRAAEAAADDAEPADDAAELIGPGGDDPRWDDPPPAPGLDALAGFADRLGGACGRAAAADRRLYGFATTGVSSTFVGTSAGLRRRWDQPAGTVELNVKSADGARSVWAAQAVHDGGGFDVDALERDAMVRYDWTRRRVELPAGRYTAVLPPSAVADLMVNLYWSAAARDAEEGRTVFSGRDGGTRLGERLTPVDLTVRSDPRDPRLPCAPFEVATSSWAGVTSVFDNGADVRAAAWVTAGRLTDLARSRAWARRTGTAFRPMVGNLVVEGAGATGTDLDLVAGVERGLLLTCFWYIREVDPQTLLVTGLTRDGVFLVEDGAVVGATNNFRFNESPVGLLARITGVGATVPTYPREWGEWFPRVAAPPLRVDGFNMSTVSDAT